MDVLKFPLYYISFKKKASIEKHYADLGFTNVHHFSAVNGKRLDYDKLLNDRVITPRWYYDLLYGNRDNNGPPGPGAIGCTLSHYELWQLCLSKKYPCIIIVEEDNRIPKKLTAKDFRAIKDAIKKPNGVFMSSHRNKKTGRIQGTHFYIASQGACKKLIDKTFPMSLPTDMYMAYMDKQKNISVEGYVIGSQNTDGWWNSSIQDTRLLTYMPRSNWFWIGMVVLFLALIAIVIFLLSYKKNCVKQ